MVEILRHVAPPICPDSIGASKKTRKFSKFLIANEMHSRKCATSSQHATYDFLIANEIQSLRNANRPSSGPAAGRPPVSSLAASQARGSAFRTPVKSTGIPTRMLLQDAAAFGAPAVRTPSSSSEFLIDTPAIRIELISLKIKEGDPF